MQVPKHVLRELKRRHPTISILWSGQTSQWILMQETGGAAHFVHAFSGLPTMANTVKVLDKAHWRNWEDKRDQERQLHEIDNSHVDKSREADRQDMIREGSSELFNRLTNRKVIPVR